MKNNKFNLSSTSLVITLFTALMISFFSIKSSSAIDFDKIDKIAKKAEKISGQKLSADSSDPISKITNQVEKKVDNVIDKIDQKIEKVVSRIEQRVEKYERKIDEYEKKIERAEKTIDQVMTTINQFDKNQIITYLKYLKIAVISIVLSFVLSLFLVAIIFIQTIRIGKKLKEIEARK